MRRQVAVAACTAALIVPSGAFAANPGSDDASPCGAYHGMFAFPAHGTLIPFVPVFARNGDYKHGTVGDRAKNPICHVLTK